MKLTLRKANAIQLLINEQLNTKAVNAFVTIGKYSDVDTAVKEASTVFDASVTFKLNLIEVLYAIRELVSDASNSVGVSSILTDLAKINKIEALFKTVSETTNFYPGTEAIKQQHHDLRNAIQTSTFRQADSFSVSLLSKQAVELYGKNLSELRKKKQKLSDKLLELNIKTEIELADKFADILTAYDIV